MAAYDFPVKGFTESDCVARLFEMYQGLTKRGGRKVGKCLEMSKIKRIFVSNNKEQTIIATIWIKTIICD